MAHCDEYVELISAAMDGALSPTQREQLEAHLAQCPECRSLYEDLTAIHTTLGELPPVEVPADLSKRIMEAVAAEQVLPFAPAEKKRSRRPWQRWLASAAVLAIVLAGTWKWKPWQAQDSTADAAPQMAAHLPAEEQSADDSEKAAPEAAPIPEAADLGDPAAGADPTARANQVSPSDTTSYGPGSAESGQSVSQDQNSESDSFAQEDPLPRTMLRAAPLPTENGSQPPPHQTEEEAVEGSAADSLPQPVAGIQPFMASMASAQPEESALNATADGASNSVQITSVDPDDSPEPREAPIPLTKEDALDLVAEYCFGNSGYETVREDLEEDVPSARFTLLDGAEPFTGGTIVYTGETEEFFLFECHWNDEPENPYHYSVHKTEGYVAWQGEGNIDGEFRP